MPKVPTVTKITVKRIIDGDPDLSYLQQNYEEKEFSETQRIEYKQKDKERLESYGTFWFMLGIKAEAEYLIPNGSYAIIQNLHSGGLWGVESDSGKDYLESIENEQIDELKDYCRKMNIEIPSNVEIIREV